MMGNEDSVGIIPKAIQHVFKVICEIPEREFLLRVSYMEIYNETITDLLCDIRKKKPLGIREDVNRNTYVEDLIEEVVVSPEQVMQWIRKGEKNRHYGETKMNEHSSRSHTIFRMIIESRERSDPANANCDGAVMVSHLNLVDLAGSERASQTGSEAPAGTIAALATDGGGVAGASRNHSAISPSLRFPRSPHLLASGTLCRGVSPARANRKRPGEKFKLRWRLGRWVVRRGAGEERGERLLFLRRRVP
ncbi:PREDICTED: centromere-associated protein E-like [Calidris pugnax]|uniref:centromere-associated protein E-like n=1 Tax=Calidris pugnax TaxID=198806 RepID=UPI00071D84F7|nr:PREDICTED: centromere-associated protein E-like [Calidris pugnax]